MIYYTVTDMLSHQEKISKQGYKLFCNPSHVVWKISLMEYLIDIFKCLTFQPVYGCYEAHFAKS